MKWVNEFQLKYFSFLELLSFVCESSPAQSQPLLNPGDGIGYLLWKCHQSFDSLIACLKLNLCAQSVEQCVSVFSVV